MIQPQYTAGQTPRFEVPKVKIATMIDEAGSQSESIVILSDNESTIYDYKLINNEQGKVCFVKTPVFIGLRFVKSDNDDILEKKKFLAQVQISFIEKRLQALDQVIRQQGRAMVDTSSNISYEFKDTCKMCLLNNKRKYNPPTRTGLCDADIEVLS